MLACRARLETSMSLLPAAAIALVLSAPAPPSPGPTLAIEDTMYTEVPEILVRAPRITLDEILDRVARGEARRESLMVDQAFTATFRVVRGVKDKGGPRLAVESVTRVYRKRPDRVRSVTIRQWQEREKKGRSANVSLSFRPGMDEEIVNFAFRPEARRDYRYHIVGRDLVGGHLIYRITFEPRSPLDPTIPSGLVWVDTNDFVIARQEVRFDRSPVPLFIKGIDRMVIERQKVDGHWVLHRVLMRAESTVPIPGFGHSFDVSFQFDQYAINRGIDDAVFVTSTRH